MTSDPPTVGELFAGIGGIGLGLERSGFAVKWHVEIDPFCRHVLEHRRPGVPTYGDIRTIDWSTVGSVDVLAGGFPCQPVSVAGLQAAQADPRWLWPEFERAIRDLRPRVVLVENVRNLLSANGGGAFADVLGSLAALGFDAEWDCIPASAVGAPHQRDRLWLVAVMADAEVEPVGAGLRAGGLAEVGWGRPGDGGGSRDVADPASLGVEGRRAARIEVARLPSRAEISGRDGAGARSGDWRPEPDVGRVADGVPARVDRLRALGNAVVPQVVEIIGEALMAREFAQ